jgi:hypothetical protein
MESTTVKTIWHSELEAARRRGGVYTPSPFSTLNEKFGILAGETLPANVMPEIGFLTIGRGGHRNVSGANNASLTDTLQHRITDACLFEHIPWVLRETNNDLPAAERKKYRLRRLEQHNGKDYFAYYMKAVTISSTATEIKKITIVNGEAVIDTYTPTAQQLSPVPVSMTNGEVNESTGTSLSVSSEIREVLTNSDMSEIINACEIIYGDRRYAQITEMSLCSGADTQITVNDGGIPVTYDEVRVAQCLSFIGCDYTLMYQNNNITLDFSVGNSLPYYI